MEPQQERYVAPAADIRSGDRIVVEAGDKEIAVLWVDGEFVAYENRCPHQGGPVGEGQLFKRIETVLDDTGAVLNERYVDTETHLVCPWHGWEFGGSTGVCIADPRIRLRSYPVTIREGDVYVLV